MGHQLAVSEASVAFSVIIPTWNEAGWLPGLLDRLGSFEQVCEIIVADNDSQDQTREIAIRYGCKVVRGGRPAQGRNSGARVACSRYLLFLDADAVFRSDCLRAGLATLASGASCAVHFPLEPLDERRLVQWCYRTLSAYVRLMGKIGVAQGLGTLIAVERSAFERIGGFREDLAVGEDIDFLRRLGQIGNVEFNEALKVGVSARRFCIESPTLFAAKTVMWGLLRLGAAPFSLVSYRWQPYPASLAQRDEVLIGRYLAKQGTS
jgi:glycosyltransferase involved in cell wall biosynthesis